MEIFDLVIIGAGPAGLFLAKELSGDKFKILVLDKKKNAGDIQYKTAGSFINPKEWNLPQDIFYSINRVCFFSNNFSVRKEVIAYSIDRKKLLFYLEKEARKNPNFKIEYNTLVQDLDFKKDKINFISYLKNKKIKRVSAKIFVDCSGLSAVLGKKLGISPKNPILCLGCEYLVPLKKEPYTIDLFVGKNFRGGYGWILPVSKKRALVGYGTIYKKDFKNIEERLKKMWNILRVKERCSLVPMEKHIGLLITGNPLKVLRRSNLIIIGDSALQANPLIGEGVRFVMDSARIASKYIKESIIKNNLRLIDNYQKEWVKKYYKKYKLAFLIQKELKKFSFSDKKMDRGVEELSKISNSDFLKIISGEINRSFIFKIAKSILKRKDKLIFKQSKF